MLRDIGDYGVDKGGITSLRDDPDRGELLFDELIRRGIIAYNPKTKRYVYQGQGAAIRPRLYFSHHWARGLAGYHALPGLHQLPMNFPI